MTVIYGPESNRQRNTRLAMRGVAMHMKAGRKAKILEKKRKQRASDNPPHPRPPSPPERRSSLQEEAQEEEEEEA